MCIVIPRKVCWALVPIVAVSLAGRDASGQTCDGAIEATATVVNMDEAGGVGASVQRLTERALAPLVRPRPAARRDTTVRIRRTTITSHALPPRGDRVQITVVYPD
jgi:hypothetical protein